MVIYRIVINILRYFYTVLPYKRNTVVFLGPGRGNIQVLYDYYIKNCSNDVSVSWIKRDPSKVEVDDRSHLRSPLSLKSVLHLAMADVAVSCHHFPWKLFGIDDSVTKIYLTHGNPIKGSGSDSPTTEFQADIYTTTSEFGAELWQRRINPVPEDAIEFAITGYPRNDMFYDNSGRYQLNTELSNVLKKYEQTILYAPTQRQPWHINKGSTTDVFPFENFDVAGLVSFLDKRDAVLLLNIHPREFARIKSTPEAFRTKHDHENLLEFLSYLDDQKNIILLNKRQFNHINQILARSDCLITDYSSIYHDYLLLDRPIIFLPYDYDEFKLDQGFAYDYFKYLPGETVSTVDSLLDQIDKIIAGKDVIKKTRSELRNKMHQYKDGDSAERVSELINRNLK